MNPPPLPAQPFTRMQPKKPSNQWISILVTALLTFVITSAGWLLAGGVAGISSFFAGAVDDFTGTPFRVSFEEEFPQTINKGEVVTLAAFVEPNESEVESAVLSRIDIQQSIFDCFELVEIRPEPKPRFELLYGYKCYRLDDPVKLDAGDVQVVEIELRAVTPVNVVGDIDFCTPTESFATVSLDLTVVDPDPPPGWEEMAEAGMAE